MGTAKSSSPGFIRPSCNHDRKDMPAAAGWIFTCPEDYDAAIRQNIVKYADCLTAERLERDALAARETIQKLTADIEDMKMSRRTAFIRCGCGRMKELNIDCRGCGT